MNFVWEWCFITTSPQKRGICYLSPFFYQIGKAIRDNVLVVTTSVYKIMEVIEENSKVVVLTMKFEDSHRTEENATRWCVMPGIISMYRIKMVVGLRPEANGHSNGVRAFVRISSSICTYPGASMTYFDTVDSSSISYRSGAHGIFLEFLSSVSRERERKWGNKKSWWCLLSSLPFFSSSSTHRFFYCLQQKNILRHHPRQLPRRRIPLHSLRSFAHHTFFSSPSV